MSWRIINEQYSIRFYMGYRGASRGSTYWVRNVGAPAIRGLSAKVGWNSGAWEKMSEERTPLDQLADSHDTLVFYCRGGKDMAARRETVSKAFGGVEALVPGYEIYKVGLEDHEEEMRKLKTALLKILEDI